MSAAPSLAALDAPARGSGVEPRLRLGAALGFLCLLPLLSSPAALAAALLLGCATLAWAGISPRVALGRLALVEGFLVGLLVTLPFAVPGTPAFALGWLSASWEGIYRALAIVVRVNAGLLVALGLLSGLGATGLAAAMTGLGLPARLAALLQLTLRQIGLLEAEYRRLRRAMAARGFRPAANRHGWRMLGNLVGMMLVRSLERAERVRGAMLCRGHAGRFPLPPGRALGRADAGFALASIAVLAALVAIEALA